MDLSIILVNWNSAEYLRAALKSIYAEVKSVAFEVIVVDSASYDGSAEMVAQEFPQVTFIQSTANIGFAAANNLGYQRSSGNAILFLNPDTEVVGDALCKMVAHLNSDEKIGAVGCRVLNSDRTVQTACVQAFPTILNQVLDARILQTAFPSSRLWGTQALTGRGPQPVQVVAGSCLMVKRAAFDLARGFDNRYFMYVEDLDLCHTLWQLGYRVEHVPDASVIHHGGSSASTREESQFATVMQRESMRKFFHKTGGPVYAAIYRASMGAAALIRMALVSISIPFRMLSRSRRKYALPPLRKWFRVFRWALGLERWSKKAAYQASITVASRQNAST
ncbi:MAG: glycosyltransferase family 2 protein [Terriglobales bacterium]